MNSQNILQPAYDDIGTVIPVFPEKEYNRTDYVNKMTVLLSDLSERFGLDINAPRALAEETYEECIRYDDTNSRGIVEGIYIDIGSEMVIVDSILDKSSGTDFPYTSVYYVYALNLKVRHFSEHSTAYITTAPSGRRKHVKQVWEMADDNVRSIDSVKSFSFRPPQIVAIEMDEALNKIFDEFADTLPDADPGTENRNMLHREFTYMSFFCFILMAQSRPETKANIPEAQQFVGETLSVFDQFFFMLPEYYGNRDEMIERISLYFDKVSSVEDVAILLKTLLKKTVIRSNEITDSYILILTVNVMNAINAVLDN